MTVAAESSRDVGTTFHGRVDEDGDITFDNIDNIYFDADMLKRFATMLIELAGDVESELAQHKTGEGFWEYGA
jgi:hypothetical protein